MLTMSHLRETPPSACTNTSDQNFRDQVIELTAPNPRSARNLRVLRHGIAEASRTVVRPVLTPAPGGWVGAADTTPEYPNCVCVSNWDVSQQAANVRAR